MIKKILCLTIFVLSAATANETINNDNEVECQNNKTLVWYDKMCSSDLEKIAKENKDNIRIKRTLSKYDNINLTTVNFLAEEKDLVVRKRLIENKAVPETLKNKLIEELNLINTFKK